MDDAGPGWHRTIGVLLGVAVVALLAAYLVAQNISAYDAQPQIPMVVYRLVVSAVLMVPGIALVVWPARSGDWRGVMALRAALLGSWCVGALTASFMLGI